MKNKLIKNLFLREKEQELQKLAYYGEFLVLSDFDDGWKYQMEKQLLDYLASLDFWEQDSKINLQIEREIDKEKWEIFAILKSQSLNSETEEKILEISTKLQKRFFMTPVNQKVGFGSSEDSVLPVEVGELSESDFWYERMKFQKNYAEILSLEQKIKNISYYIENKNIDNDEITLALINELKNIKDIYSNDILTLKESLDKISVELYDNLAIKTILGSNKTTILNKVHQNNAKEEENNTVIDESKVDLSKHSLWKIWECTLDKYKCIVSAKLLDNDERIYSDDSKNKVVWFNLEWLDSIKYIEVLEFNENKEVILFRVVIWASYYYYFFKEDKYERLQIWDHYVNINLDNYKSDKKTWKPLYWSINIWNNSKAFFWTENWEYNLIWNINWKIESIWYIKYNNNWKPIFWQVFSWDKWIDFILDPNTWKYIKKGFFMKNPYKK